MINRELSVLIVGRVLQIIIALMAIKIATKFLQADELGNFYLLVSITGFFSLFMVNPIGQYINRRTHDWHKQKKLLNVFYLYNFFLFFLTLFCLLVYFLFLFCFPVFFSSTRFFSVFYISIYFIR